MQGFLFTPSNVTFDPVLTQSLPTIIEDLTDGSVKGGSCFMIKTVLSEAFWNG